MGWAERISIVAARMKGGADKDDVRGLKLAVALNTSSLALSWFATEWRAWGFSEWKLRSFRSESTSRESRVGRFGIGR